MHMHNRSSSRTLYTYMHILVHHYTLSLTHMDDNDHAYMYLDVCAFIVLCTDLCVHVRAYVCRIYMWMHVHGCKTKSRYFFFMYRLYESNVCVKNISH
jgi:hypothetical protein